MPVDENLTLYLWIAAWLLAVLIALVGSLAGGRRRAAPLEREPEARDAISAHEAARRGAVEPSYGPPYRDRFLAGLAKTRNALAGRLSNVLRTDVTQEALVDELERALIESDVGIRSTQRLLDAVRRLPANERTPAGIRAALRHEVRELVSDAPAPAEPSRRPWVILVVGVNGVGKTTTIGKLAARHRAAGRSVLLIAADTFRAAAIEQLTVWAGRTGSQIVKQEPGSDPASVVFDGMKAASARGSDVVIVDTAGRLHTKVNLMEELKKVRRVLERSEPEAPHEVLLVLDATTGQNAISQARTFREAVAVTGVVLTKLDGSARGGITVAIRHELGLPVQYVGLGESEHDLQPFDADAYLDGLFPSG